MALDGLVEAIDRLVELGGAGFADGESIEELERQRARLDAVVTASVAAFDASEQWAGSGAPNLSTWLAVHCRLPKSEAHRQVAVGRALVDLPLCTRSWLAGDINVAHMAALVKARTSVTAEVLARDEELLVDQARTLRYRSFVRAMQYWSQLADPDGVEAASERGRGRRDVSLCQSFDGMWFGSLTFDPVSGAVVAEELARLERELFEEDWAEARGRLGRDPLPSELARRSGQRRADAMVVMAERSRSSPADGRRPVPLFTVLVDYPTFLGRVCELADGTVVTPGALVPWLGKADVERAVFKPGGRVEVGVRNRLFSGATRRAIEIRDRQCVHDECDRPVSACEIDHIVPYAAGGLTIQENGRLLCSFHNRLRHQRPPPAD